MNTSSSTAIHLLGAGHALPDKVVTNCDLEKTLDTSDTWIVQRTGIKKRHIAAPQEFTSHLAIRAAKNALDQSDLSAQDIDLIILGTTTPDNTFPATAVRVQHALGATGIAFDVSAVCAGFVFALATADAYLKAGLAKRALVIGAETMSRLLDWSDRSTAVLFGDGAGAVVLEARPKSRGAPSQGLIGHALHTDGAGYDALLVKGGVSAGKLGHIHMDGRAVFMRATRELAAVSEEVLKNNQIAPSQIDWIVPHQANIRIIEATRNRLGIAEEKVYLTVAEHANTSAASIPLAFSQGVETGHIKKGQLILFQAFGAGFAWGASLFRFS